MESWLPHPVFDCGQTLSGPTDLFLPIAANLLLMISVLMAKGSHELAHCIYEILLSELNTEE
jgi:hypothetical protein